MSATNPRITGTSPVQSARPKTNQLLALSGGLLAIGAFFLPWIGFVANARTVLVLTGWQTATTPIIQTSGEVVLFRGSVVNYLAPALGLVAMLLTLIAWRRGRVTAWESFGLTGLASVSLLVIWLRMVNAAAVSEKAGALLQYQAGLWLTLLALLLLMVVGVRNVRALSSDQEGLQGALNAWGFMAPASFLVIVFFVIPVIILIILSLTNLSSANFSEPWHFIGLENYRRMFSDTFFPKILGNTFRYVILTLGFFNVGLALLLALLSTHIDRRAGAFFRLLWLLPRITPSVVYIVMWQRIAQQPPYGIINQFLARFGAEIQASWVAEMPWLFVVLVNGFVGASFGMIIFTSAIESIPVDLVRAAKVDGASTLQVIRDITLPLLRWPLLFVLTYQTLSLLVSFEYILLLTNGGPGLYTTEVWALTAYKRALGNYFGSNQWGYGAAWGFVLVAIGITLSAIYLRVFRFNELVQEPKIDVL